MESIKGGKPLLLNYAEANYISSTLDYEEHEINVIIDTGAQRSILFKDILDIVPHKINKRITIKITDFFGDATKAQIAKIKRIFFGDYELKNFSFVFLDNFYGSLGSDNLQGIVGIDILEYFDLHFTANEYVLKLVEPKRKKEDSKIWMSKELINVDGFWGFYSNIGEDQIFTVIDTGLPGYLSIPTSFQKDITWVEPTEEELSFFHLWADNDDYITPIIIKEIKIFDEEIVDLPAIMNPGIDDILIGLDLLSKFDLIISFKRKKIYFKK